MYQASPGLRAYRQTAGAIGAVALMVLGATPAAAEDSAPGLVLEDIAAIDGVKPGSRFEVPAGFTNTGSEALGKVWLSYSVTRGLSHTELPSNCLRYDVGSFDEAPSKSSAVCAFDQTVRPGVVYAPEKPLTLDALDHALYDDLRVTVSTYDAAPGDGAAEPVRGTAPAVELVERPDATPAPPGSAERAEWDAADVDVTAVNTADFQVTGARLKGAVGDTVDLTVRFTNAGPGWLYRSEELGIPATRVLIGMPAGTTVTKGNGNCTALSAGSYRCGTPQAWVDEDEGVTYAFKVRIDKAVAGAKGSVALDSEPRPFDDDKANDTAVITLDVTGGGSTGGGSTGGGSTGGGSASTTGGSGSASTGGSDSTAGSGSAAGGSSGDGGSAAAGSSTAGSTDASADGGLASTGSSALPLAGAAAAAVAAGAAAVLVTRRRRAARR
ncbi:hypothetical protein ACIF8T_10455 [Streptomyces sp. NPDC085946]|uniref:hypothetical protein n=1 Tax=Streptomyces sp. NPDC085946 TaxID=3365744 RepID=UPI0037D34C88